MLITRICQKCGNEFARRKDNSKKFKFCSKECSGGSGGMATAEARKKRWDAETEEQARSALMNYFISRVKRNENGCWQWTGCIRCGVDKYGIAIFRGKKMQAHHVSWKLHKGEMPAKKLLMHTCGNKSCVNPDHLIVSWTKVDKVCDNCGKVYKVFYYREEVSRFCSGRCRSSYGGKMVHKENYDKWSLETKEETMLEIKKRLDRHVVKSSGCWKWTSWKSKQRYGRISFRGQQLIASRASWMAYRGEIPKGMNVCHTCDNPECTNPEHLFLGTHTDNQRDKIKKGRGHRNSLTVEKVIIIKKKIAIGIPMSRIAKDYGVCLCSIKNIKYGKTWRDV